MGMGRYPVCTASALQTQNLQGTWKQSTYQRASLDQHVPKDIISQDEELRFDFSMAKVVEPTEVGRFVLNDDQLNQLNQAQMKDFILNAFHTFEYI